MKKKPPVTIFIALCILVLATIIFSMDAEKKNEIRELRNKIDSLKSTNFLNDWRMNSIENKQCGHFKIHINCE